MKFSKKLEEGIFLKRSKRFFAEIDWDGQTIVAHVPNTGSMKGCNTPGSRCLFSHSDNPERKLKFTLEMIEANNVWVGVNTATPNKIVREAIEAGHFPSWKKMKSFKAEHKISAETRFDFLLEMPGDKKHFIEVKNVSMAEDGVAMFPDSVTERGQKHLRELTRLVKEGHSAEIVFTIQRSDAKSFTSADHIDEDYGKLLRAAIKAGVKVTPVLVDLSAKEVRLSETVLKIKT